MKSVSSLRSSDFRTAVDFDLDPNMLGGLAESPAFGFLVLGCLRCLGFSGVQEMQDVASNVLAPLKSLGVVAIPSGTVSSV